MYTVMLNLFFAKYFIKRMRANALCIDENYSYFEQLLRGSEKCGRNRYDQIQLTNYVLCKICFVFLAHLSRRLTR